MNSMRNTAINHTPFQRGLSLIELMIAMLVGLILIGGVLSIFISSRQSYGINSAVARIQENARFALGFISKPTRMAGYMGCGLSTSNFANDLKSNALPYGFTNGIVGYEYTGTGPGNTRFCRLASRVGDQLPVPTTGVGFSDGML